MADAFAFRKLWLLKQRAGSAKELKLLITRVPVDAQAGLGLVGIVEYSAV